MSAQPEHPAIHIERMLLEAKRLRHELIRTSANGTTSTWDRWAKRCGLSVAIPILTAAAWLLSRSKAQVATTAGVATILGAITTALVLLPHREPLDDDSAPQPAPDQPSRTIQSPTTVTTPPTTSVPAASTPNVPPIPSQTPPEPTAAEPAEPTPSEPAPTPPGSPMPQGGAPAPTSAPPPENDNDDGGSSSEEDHGDEEGDGDDRDSRRTQCLQVLPTPETDIDACVAIVAELLDEISG